MTPASYAGDEDLILVRNNTAAPIPLAVGGPYVAAGETAAVRDLDTQAIQDALADGGLEVLTEGAFHHEPGPRGPVTTGPGIERSGAELELERRNTEGHLR